jgi:hypothetical protein
VLTGFPGSHPGQGKKEAFANLEWDENRMFKPFTRKKMFLSRLTACSVGKPPLSATHALVWRMPISPSISIWTTYSRNNVLLQGFLFQTLSLFTIQSSIRPYRWRKKTWFSWLVSNWVREIIHQLHIASY